MHHNLTSNYYRSIYCILLGLFLAMPTSSLLAQEPTAENVDLNSIEQKASFLRVAKSDGKPISLQTSISRFRPKTGDLVVDLIGAIHIGESSYYKNLNRQFELYDVVLYELVAPKGTRIPRGGKPASQLSSNPLSIVGWMQGQAQQYLGLGSQLNLIDYQKKNLVHADLSPAEMARKMEQRGDTAWSIGMSAMQEIMQKQRQLMEKNSKNQSFQSLQEMSSLEVFAMLENPLQLKQFLAEQFAQTGRETGLGTKLDQLIIADRNEAAMKVLDEQIKKGKTKIAIFYGAAHMPDFEDRLVNDFRLHKTKQVWVDAWDLTQSKGKSLGGVSSSLMNIFKELAK
ncbi:MAG: hypothetical protein AAF939_13750 [Planctomycetota bacterium]